jgi:hypothetical protein
MLPPVCGLFISAAFFGMISDCLLPYFKPNQRLWPFFLLLNPSHEKIKDQPEAHRDNHPYDPLAIDEPKISCE